MGQIINSTDSRNVNPQTQAVETLSLFMANNPEAASQFNFITDQIPGAHYLRPYQHYIPMSIPTNNITEKVPLSCLISIKIHYLFIWDRLILDSPLGHAIRGGIQSFGQ